MGGSGSGRSANHATVESAFKLPLAFLLEKIDEAGRHFRATLSRGGDRLCMAIESLDVQVELGDVRGWVRLRYTATTYRGDEVPVDERIDIVSGPQPYGGRLWFFECPRLGHRVKTLYLPWGASRFASRQAYRLSYTSSRLSQKDRALTTAQNIRMAMGGEGDVFDEFPERPSGMRQKRYERLRARAEAASEISMAALNASMPRLLAWFDKVDAKKPRRRVKA